jgi:sec-independent protein translocase protein TatB
MNILGVGPLELVFILVLGLIVLGPERLPEAGRFLGRQLARVLAWQQQSPEAQLIQQIRAEFEQEIVGLRDEIVRARQQIDVSSDFQRLQTETRSLLSPPAGVEMPAHSIAPPRIVPQPGVVPAGMSNGGPAAAPPAPAAADPAPAPPTTTPDGDDPGRQIVERRRRLIEGDYGEDDYPYPAVEPGADVAGHTPAAPSDDDLLARVRALAADLAALQEQLRERGLLAPDWQPPSHAKQPEQVPQ